ncbi:MAG: hypothetical protein IT324_30695 [Anaerolineae bacterium]|nr:hypothetical protein [Anaerolineae bacterium]
MDTFALKLLLTPTLIGLISLAGRRWGPAISGLLVGLPLTSDPIAFFLALNQGASFASATALGTLAGTISQAAFCVTYWRFAFRFGWMVSVLLSSLVFIVSTVSLQWLNLPLIPLYVLVVLSLILALRFTTSGIDTPLASAKRLPSWDIPARMIVATTYVVLLTSVAPQIGPHLTGLLSPFPLYAAILAVFAHRLQGPAPAVSVVRGLVVGLFGFASFFLVLSGLLPQVGITAAFAAAIVTVLTIQAAALWILRRTSGA